VRNAADQLSPAPVDASARISLDEHIVPTLSASNLHQANDDHTSGSQHGADLHPINLGKAQPEELFDALCP